MSRITDELSKYGCDMNTTLERFLGDEDFYEKCLIEMLGDSSFRELGEALQQKNVKAAFESAHTLKGLAANMGLDSMLDIVVELVEPLRNGMIDGLSPTYERLIDEKKTYDNIVNGQKLKLNHPVSEKIGEIMETKTILIVDDALTNRVLLKRYLEDDYNIIEAENGQRAIDIIDEQQLNISLILLDLIMPEKSGFDVLEFMSDYGFISEIPVIIVTVEANYENEMKAFEYGVSDFITKPFYPQIVQKRVKNVIDLYDTQKNLRRLLDEQTIDTMELVAELEHMSDNFR